MLYNFLIQEGYTRRREAAASQQADPESQGSSTPKTDDQLLLEEIGDRDPKGRIYGFGSQAEYFYGSTTGAGSSRGGPQYGSHEQEQMRQDYERLQAELLQQQQTIQAMEARHFQAMEGQRQEMQERFARLEAMMIQQQGGFSSRDQPPPFAPPAPVRAQPGISIRDGSIPTSDQRGRSTSDDYLNDDFAGLDDIGGTMPPPR